MLSLMKMPGRVFRCLMLLVSLCVFFLGLGIPTPSLLSVVVFSDNLEASIFEGLSLPASAYYRQQFAVSPAVLPILTFEQIAVDSSLFHPPIG
jgi:hypothetical protein